MIILKVNERWYLFYIQKNLNSNMIILKVKPFSTLFEGNDIFKFQYDNT